jgi:hypothetical protein
MGFESVRYLRIADIAPSPWGLRVTHESKRRFKTEKDKKGW